MISQEPAFSDGISGTAIKIKYNQIKVELL